MSKNEFGERVACSVKEAAHLTGLSRSSVYLLIGHGTIETAKIGRRRLVLLGSLRHLLAMPAPEDSARQTPPRVISAPINPRLSKTKREVTNAPRPVRVDSPKG